MRFFKYLPKKYLTAFFESGSIKIGTLHEYRKVEQYGTVIGDKEEGVHKTELFIPGGGEIDLASSTPEAEFFRQHVLRADQRNSKVKVVLADGARLVAHSNSPDLYIYCVTSEYSEAVMQQFNCDACFEILFPRAFFRAIGKKIGSSVRYDGFGPVRYGSKNTHYQSPHQLHPAIMKETEFSYQKEWRAIWVPQQSAPEPLFIQVPHAIKYCRVHAP